MRTKPWIPIKTLCIEAKKKPFPMSSISSTGNSFLHDPDVRYRGHEAVGRGSRHLPGQGFR